MAYYHFHRAAFFCISLFFLFLPFSAGQDIPATPGMENHAETEPVEPLTIKLSVEEVRLDVVVLDKKGNPITDLTADDFEVYQDNKRQKVLAAVYIDLQSDASAQPALTGKESSRLPGLPTPVFKKEDVRRTIIFVLNDLIMNFGEKYYAKMALRNFVEKQMQTGDMVAVLQTGYGNSALQMFLSDKRELLARIDAMRLEMTNGLSTDRFERASAVLPVVLDYGIRVLKDMPGRKFIISIAPGVGTELNSMDANLLFQQTYTDGRLYRVADNALRAGVVVNHLDIRGLQNFDDNYADASVGLGPFPTIGRPQPIDFALSKLQSPRQDEKFASFLYNPLPNITGGVLTNNSNFFLDGISREAESLMRGYYLVSYAPPPSTFDGKEKYYHTKINVKRKGAVVHTRNGFYNQATGAPEAVASKEPLMDAIYSPFLHADLIVNMAAGYVQDANAGYLLRSWIHLDPKNVKITETEGGGGLIDLETVCLTSDTEGYLHDIRHIRYTFNLEPENKAENIAWIREHGVRFLLTLPVKKPGAYYVRIAIRDVETGSTGSAYQFLPVPDLKKKGLELSNLFMITSSDDLLWMNSDATKELSQGEFSVVFHADEVRSPALRTYASGDSLFTLSILYNADAKAIARSEIETHSVLYKDGREFLRGDSSPVNPENAENPGGIPFLQRVMMGTDMPPGDYVLQLVVIDKKNDKKQEGVAAQTLSFTIVEK